MGWMQPLPLPLPLPSYIKDTMEFIELKKNFKLPVYPVFLVTMDVDSLYTNVPFEGGLEAIEFFLDQRLCQVPSTACLSDLAKLVLSYNYFLFGSDYYLQISGVNMGSKMAPSFASLFCGMFEQLFVLNPGANEFLGHIVL